MEIPSLFFFAGGGSEGENHGHRPHTAVRNAGRQGHCRSSRRDRGGLGGELGERSSGVISSESHLLFCCMLSPCSLSFELRDIYCCTYVLLLLLLPHVMYTHTDLDDSFARILLSAIFSSLFLTYRFVHNSNFFVAVKSFTARLVPGWWPREAAAPAAPGPGAPPPPRATAPPA